MEICYRCVRSWNKHFLFFIKKSRMTSDFCLCVAHCHIVVVYYSFILIVLLNVVVGDIYFLCCQLIGAFILCLRLYKCVRYVCVCCVIYKRTYSEHLISQKKIPLLRIFRHILLLLRYCHSCNNQSIHFEVKVYPMSVTRIEVLIHSLLKNDINMN